MDNLRFEDQSQRLLIPDRSEITDGSFAPDDLLSALDSLEKGSEKALLLALNCVLNVNLLQTPKLAHKTVKKLLKKIFEQPRPELAGSYASIVTSSIAQLGWLSEKTSNEIFISLLYGMLMNASEIGMNILKEMIRNKKKKDFRSQLCQRGGILKHITFYITHLFPMISLPVISIQQQQSSQSSSSSSYQKQNIPIRTLLNIFDVLQELTKYDVSQWDTDETEELQQSLQNAYEMIRNFEMKGKEKKELQEKILNIDEEKKSTNNIKQEIESEEEQEDDDDKQALMISLEILLQLLDKKVLKSRNKEKEKQKNEMIEKINSVKEEKNQIEEENKELKQRLIASEEQRKEIEERSRITEEEKKEVENRLLQSNEEKMNVETEIINLEQKLRQSEEKLQQVEIEKEKEINEKNTIEERIREYEEQVHFAEEQQNKLIIEKKELEQRVHSTETMAKIFNEEKNNYEKRANEAEQKMKYEQINAEQKLLNSLNLKSIENNTQIKNDSKILQLEKKIQELNNRIIEFEKPCCICGQIGEFLKKEIKGSEIEQKEIKQKKNHLIELIILSFKGKQDELGKRRAINCGITESILHIFASQPLDTISRIYCDAFFLLSFTTEQNKQLIIEKQPFAGLLRNLEHSDSYIVTKSIDTIFNLLLCGLNTNIATASHQYFDNVHCCDGINKIYSLFKRNINKDITNTAALCIGQLFKAREITDSLMRQEIISHLKSLINDSNDWAKNAAKKRLEYLSQNEVNLEEIEKDGFKIPP